MLQCRRPMQLTKTQMKPLVITHCTEQNTSRPIASCRMRRPAFPIQSVAVEASLASLNLCRFLAYNDVRHRCYCAAKSYCLRRRTLSVQIILFSCHCFSLRNRSWRFSQGLSQSQAFSMPRAPKPPQLPAIVLRCTM